MHAILTSQHPDYTYRGAHILYWTCIECNLAIVCPCAMTLRPLVSQTIPRLFSVTQSTAAYVGEGSRSTGRVVSGQAAGPLNNQKRSTQAWERWSDEDSGEVILHHMAFIQAPSPETVE
jgi:hypothetical protein